MAIAMEDDGHSCHDGRLAQTLSLLVPSFTLTEELVDALDAQHVPDELIVQLAAREERASGPRGLHEDSPAPLPQKARQLSARLLALLNHVVAPSAEDWFASVALLDAVALRGLRPELLPATCAAAARLVKKVAVSETRYCAPAVASKTLELASQLAPCLQRLGYTPSVVDTQTVRKQEEWILKVLQWRVNIPTHESWLSLFCTRLNVLTSNLLQPSVNWAKEQSTAAATALVIWQATTARLTPREVTVGILGINIARARLLSFEALKPEGLASAEWEKLLVDAHVDGPSSQCMLKASHSQYMLQALLATLDCSLQALQAMAQSVLLDIKSMQRDDRGTPGGKSTSSDTNI